MKETKKNIQTAETGTGAEEAVAAYEQKKEMRKKEEKKAESPIGTPVDFPLVQEGAGDKNVYHAPPVTMLSLIHI